MSRHVASVLFLLFFYLEIKARIIFCYNFILRLLVAWVLIHRRLGRVYVSSTLLWLFVLLRFCLILDRVFSHIQVGLTYVGNSRLIKQEHALIVATAARVSLSIHLWWADDYWFWLFTIGFSVEVWVRHACHSFTHRVATLGESCGFWGIVDAELLVLLLEVFFFGSNKLLWVIALWVVKSKFFVEVNFILWEGYFENSDECGDALSWYYFKSP